MLRNFLTDEEKAKLDRDNQRYREWRQSIDAVVVGEEEQESILRNSTYNYIRESTEGNLNAGEDAVKESRAGAATTKAAEGKLKVKKRLIKLEIPEISIGQRLSSEQLG